MSLSTRRFTDYPRATIHLSQGALDFWGFESAPSTVRAIIPNPTGYSLVAIGVSKLFGCLLTVLWPDFLQHFGDNWPALAPFTTPVYSNNGAAILGLVVSKVSGKSFEAFVQEKILDPLNMKHTFATKPDDKLGVISVEDTMWAADMGFTGP